MSELPNDADEVLALARSAQHEPDAAVRDRVRRGVASALLIGAAVVTPTAVAARVGASSAWKGALTAKVVAGAAVCAVALGVAVAPRLVEPSRKQPASAAQTSVAPQVRDARAPLPPSVPDLGAPAEPPPGPTVVDREPGTLAAPASTPARSESAPGAAVTAALASSPPAAPRYRVRDPQAPLSLRAELAALEQAERALQQKDPARALHVLAGHRAAFAQSSFVDEREGLTLIAQCMLDVGAAAEPARAFLARARSAVLHERVAAACRGVR